MRKYDATKDRWLDGTLDGTLDGEPVFRPRYLRREKRLVVRPPKIREGRSPRLSLIEWMIIGPMVVALGFLAGINL